MMSNFVNFAICMSDFLSVCYGTKTVEIFR